MMPPLSFYCSVGYRTSHKPLYWGYSAKWACNLIPAYVGLALNEGGSGSGFLCGWNSEIQGGHIEWCWVANSLTALQSQVPQALLLQAVLTLNTFLPNSSKEPATLFNVSKVFASIFSLFWNICQHYNTSSWFNLTTWDCCWKWFYYHWIVCSMCIITSLSCFVYMPTTLWGDYVLPLLQAAGLRARQDSRGMYSWFNQTWQVMAYFTMINSM
jgi:hypothetical protein